MMSLSSAAYESQAEEFLEAREHSNIGAAIVERWAQSLEAGTAVIELGCGGGIPVTKTLIDNGLDMWAVDASPTLLQTFTARFPNVPVDCSDVLDSC